MSAVRWRRPLQGGLEVLTREQRLEQRVEAMEAALSAANRRIQQLARENEGQAVVIEAALDAARYWRDRVIVR